MVLEHLESRGSYDFDTNHFDEYAPIEEAMQYLTILALESA